MKQVRYKKRGRRVEKLVAYRDSLRGAWRHCVHGRADGETSQLQARLPAHRHHILSERHHTCLTSCHAPIINYYYMCSASRIYSQRLKKISDTKLQGST